MIIYISIVAENRLQIRFDTAGKPMKRSLLGGAKLFEETKAQILKRKRPMLAKKQSKMSKMTSLMLTGSRQGSHQSSGSGQIASAGGPGSSKRPKIPAL